MILAHPTLIIMMMMTMMMMMMSTFMVHDSINFRAQCTEGRGRGAREKNHHNKEIKKVCPLDTLLFNLGSIKRYRLFENLRLMFVVVLFYILCLG